MKDIIHQNKKDSATFALADYQDVIRKLWLKLVEKGESKVLSKEVAV